MHTETPNVSKNTRKISSNLLWITNFSKIVTYGQYITINTVLSFVLLQEVQLIPNYLFDSNSKEKKKKCLIIIIHIEVNPVNPMKRNNY